LEGKKKIIAKKNKNNEPALTMASISSVVLSPFQMETFLLISAFGL